jgi:Fic family protein
MSAQIRSDRKEYYNALERAQRGTVDITDWLEWFLSCLVRSLERARKALFEVLRKAAVWRSLRATQLNERQRKILNLLLDAEFFGVLNTSKYGKINKCSTDTAARDLAQLVDYGVLERIGKARGTKYILRTPEDT